MQSVNPSLVRDRQKNGLVRAFALIELLGVMTVILILTAITFGVSQGVLNRQARVQAKAELAMIAQALEDFKLAYGDYPWISEEDDPTVGNANAEKLTLALTGFAIFESTGSSMSLKDVTTGDARKCFIDPEKLNFSQNFGNPSNAGDLANVFLVDPWRRPYVFVYNSYANGWDNIGYVLFSKGPDGEADLGSIVNNGIIDLKTPQNTDNIYLHQQ